MASHYKVTTWLVYTNSQYNAIVCRALLNELAESIAHISAERWFEFWGQMTTYEQSLDVFALTETWHNDSDDVSLRLCMPDGYAVIETARETGRGGVAIVFHKHLRCS